MLPRVAITPERIKHFWLLLILLPTLVQAERLPLKSYTVADGLAHNQINKIVRDSRGFLWLCTAEGLSRFDGYQFTNLGTNEGLPHSVVNDLLESHAGNYWVATNGGLVRFDPKGEATRRIVYSNEVSNGPSPMFVAVIPADTDRRARAITSLFEGRDGTIWCGTYKGVYRLYSSGAELRLEPVDFAIPNGYAEQRVVSDFVEDNYGTMWMATPSGLYRRWQDGSTARYTVRDGLPDDYLHDLFRDHAGQLWSGTRSKGFFRFNADETHRPPTIVASYSTKDGMPDNWVFQIFETSDHRFWIATSKGLVEFASEGKTASDRFRAYTTANGLIFHDITTLNEDLAGNLWLGSYAGAMKLARNATADRSGTGKESAATQSTRTHQAQIKLQQHEIYGLKTLVCLDHPKAEICEQETKP
jgi:ligand-binding sensor domain-containing protein